mgnify:CR=1 FL=1
MHNIKDLRKNIKLFKKKFLDRNLTFDEKLFEDDQYTPTMIDIVDSQKITEAVDQGSPIQEETPQESQCQRRQRGGADAVGRRARGAGCHPND